MFRKTLRPGGLLLIDEDLVHPGDDQEDLYPIPATRIATELGTKMAANVVMLGYLVGLTDMVSRQSVEEAIRSTVKASVLELDLKALDAGIRAADEHRAA
jgi:2-oxoglutarate ferredoxin oxidoreductase subunit gamma